MSDEGAIRLAAAVLALWRKDYLAALRTLKRKPSKQHRQDVEALERQCPEWLLPASITKTKEEVICKLRESAGMK